VFRCFCPLTCVCFVCFYPRVVTYSGHFVLRFHVRSSVTFRTCFVVSVHSRVCVFLNPRVVTSSGHFDLRFFVTFHSYTSVLSPTSTSAHAVTVTFRDMPPKKRVATGRVSSAATKIALLRATATPQETAATLAYKTNRSAASRARETPQESEARLAD